MKLNYRYAKKLYGQPEIEAGLQALQDGHLTEGRWCKAFEDELKHFIGCEHVILCNSGSSANLLAVAAMKETQHIKGQDKVLCPAVAFPTSIAPLVQLGYYPFYLDVDLDGNISLESIKRHLDHSTVGIMIPHLLGNPARMTEIMEFVHEWEEQENQKIWVIEDCCDSLGARYDGRHVGTFGDAGTLSFYPAHHITTGEGGAVFTNDSRIAGIIRSIRDWGRDCDCVPGSDNRCGNRFSYKHAGLPYGYDHKYVYRRLGYNLKMTEVQAAIGCAQMQRLPGIVEWRRKSHDFLKQAVKGLVYVPGQIFGSEPSPFALYMLHDDRTEICRDLESRGIQTRPIFAGDMRKQPLNHKFGYESSMRHTDMYLHAGFFIGVRPDDEDLTLVASVLNNILKKYKE